MAMAAAPPNSAVDDGLEIEKVAVGPYCIFDAFKPSVNRTTESPVIASSPDKSGKSEMDPHILNNDFAFSGAMDFPVVASAADEQPRENWNEFMQWDPNAQQSLKPLFNAQGPLCVLKQEEQLPLFSRRQMTQMRGALPTDEISGQTPLEGQMNGTPFSFGGTIQNPAAFDFDSTALSSPSSGGGQQPGEFYSPPNMWTDQQAAREGAMFAPQGFEQPDFSPIPAPPASTPSLHHSPSSLNNGHTSSSSATASPEPVQLNPKKRKSASGASDDAPAAKKDKQQPVKKTAHNMIEKRYRTNLNDKIAALRDSVPSLRVMSRPNGGNEEDDDPEDLEGLTPAHKLNKATVLSKATEYIRHLEKRNKRLQEEVAQLKSRLDGYEKMTMTGQLAMHGGPRRSPDGDGYRENPFSHPQAMVPQTVSAAPQGMIPVPAAMSNLHRGHPQQPHYAPQAAAYPPYNAAGRPGVPGPPQVNGRRASGMMGKLMVGSLAGLMVLEGWAESEQSLDTPAGRGLFALPFNPAIILSPRIPSAISSSQIPIAKLLLIFFALFYIVAPFLDFRPKPKKKAVTQLYLSRVPSLASPVEVRRKAWLTAIQTVWVPGHSFWLEVTALGLKTIKLSARKLIGWDGYALLTGITKEQEAERVKAWDIALDAQLTGGDAEISKSRLVLTLMASGTLPDTPARLMLKALHIRVLLWEFANTGSGGWRILDDLSAKLARSYWNAARSEQRIAVNMVSKPDSGAEPLPEHMAALLEMDCDAVLVPSIIQRAYNLAWNRPSAEHTTQDESMDSVVEDFAICSSLDALAAWWSCFVQKQALAASLASKDCAVKDSVKRDLELASSTAPPTSQARLRALVAQAILLDDDRSSRIAAAFQALPASPITSPSTKAQNAPRTMPMNLVGNGPMAVDIRKALTLAKCQALIQSDNPEARHQAIFVVNNTSLPEATTTLLSFVAGYKLLNHFVLDSELQTGSSQGLERLASSLRMWIGHESGRRSGIPNKIRGRIVSHCLDASKTLVGLGDREEIDDGYVSASVKGD